MNIFFGNWVELFSRKTSIRNAEIVDRNGNRLKFRLQQQKTRKLGEKSFSHKLFTCKHTKFPPEIYEIHNCNDFFSIYHNSIFFSIICHSNSISRIDFFLLFSLHTDNQIYKKITDYLKFSSYSLEMYVFAFHILLILFILT